MGDAESMHIATLGHGIRGVRNASGVIIGRVVLCGRMDRQTDRHTDRQTDRQKGEKS
jgi:hypothetical protein